MQKANKAPPTAPSGQSNAPEAPSKGTAEAKGMRRPASDTGKSKRGNSTYGKSGRGSAETGKTQSTHYGKAKARNLCDMSRNAEIHLRHPLRGLSQSVIYQRECLYPCKVSAC